MPIGPIHYLKAAMACALATASPSWAAPVPIHLRDGIEANDGSATIRVTALTDSILRVRIARRGPFPEDASWAVAAEVRRQSVAVRPTSDGFATNALAVHLDPATLRLSVT